jgi:vacuolar-type H+-ATPase subunit I/STV1
MPRADVVHLGLMLSALALAYLLPFELLLIAYAVLGPAHYLTEISWLHDRKYFLSAKPIAWLLGALAVAAVSVPSAPESGLLIWLAFVGAALAIGGISWTQRGVLLAILAVVTAALAAGGDFIAVSAVLLPTLIHVSVFTLVFMTLGAYRAGSRSQAALVLVYLGAIALILLVPPGPMPRSLPLAQLGFHYFGGVAPALGKVLHVSNLTFDSRSTGLLSFVYTYHYLNWFIKADVIGWRRIPAGRLSAIAALSLGATGLYFYDYAMGFTVLLALSLIHVVLEFPLNTVSIKQLAGIAAQGLGRQARAAS